MKSKIQLTKAQHRALKALDNLMKVNPAPSLQEWADVAGYGGGSITLAALMPHRSMLYALGFIMKTAGKTRSTRLSSAGHMRLKADR